MKRLSSLALAAGIILSALMFAPAQAAAGNGPANGQNQGGNAGHVAGTPKAVKDWHDLEKKRSANKKQAAEMRKKNMSSDAGKQAHEQ